MRTLILGAGALGGYFGARLLAAGRDVTFLVRPARAALLAAHGLHVLSPASGDVHVPSPPTLQVADSPFDLILLSAKAYDLASAMDAIAPAVGPETAIVPLLNGMAHLAQLDARFGAEHVLGGTSLISAALAPDGTIHHLNARDLLFFGDRDPAHPHPRMTDIEATLCNAGFPAALRPNILQDMWDKWTFLATLAGITCLLRANIAEIAEADATPFALALHQECLNIAAAAGYPPAAAAVEQSRHFLTAPSPLHASMLRDLEAGAPIESHQIVGDLLDRGSRHSLETPLLAIVHAHLKAYEARRKRPPIKS